MRTIRLRSRGEDVHLLNEILFKLGYTVKITDIFGVDTDNAVKDFQTNNNLVVDGIVGLKSWSKLIEKESQFVTANNKFLSEQDLTDFARHNLLELATVKAVNEVESSGKGFLLDGKPRILFEGHVFWRELAKRSVNPYDFLNGSTLDLLYEKWTKKYYRGGPGEYDRLTRAAAISNDQAVKDAAYCSASWGAFQIMGFHYKNLGYQTINQFVDDMYKNEKQHLDAFGKFISFTSFSGKKLMDWLREKNWEKFANGYNGSGYKLNKYDIKLESAYKKYSS